VDIPLARWDEVRGLIDTIRNDWSVELSVPPPGDAVRFTASKRKRDHIREELAKALGIQVNDGLPEPPLPAGDMGGDPVDIPAERWDEVRRLIPEILEDWQVRGLQRHRLCSHIDASANGVLCCAPFYHLLDLT
jgi:hypothetical protein